jgi:hypothetical protein
MPTREQLMGQTFAAIHRMDALIFHPATAFPTDWAAVAETFHEAARLATITLWRHFTWLTDPDHRWPNQPVPGETTMNDDDIKRDITNAKLALLDLEAIILQADPSAQLTWDSVGEALANAVNTIAPTLDRITTHLLRLERRPDPANPNQP